MSDLVFNLRIGCIHFQLSNSFIPKIIRNGYWTAGNWRKQPVVLYQIGNWHNQ